MGLSSSKQTLLERFLERYTDKPGYASSGWIRDTLGIIATVLSKIGITFPVLYLIPNTQRQNFARQGFLCIGPGEKVEWDVESTKMGVLVLRKIHIMPLDCDSTHILRFTITVPQPSGRSGAAENLSTVPGENGEYQNPLKPDCAEGTGFTPSETPIPCETGVAGEADAITCEDITITSRHPGLRKPLVLVFETDSKTRIKLSNTSTKFPAFVEFELQGWYA